MYWLVNWLIVRRGPSCTPDAITHSGRLVLGSGRGGGRGDARRSTEVRAVVTAVVGVQGGLYLYCFLLLIFL